MLLERPVAVVELQGEKGAIVVEKRGTKRTADISAALLPFGSVSGCGRSGTDHPDTVDLHHEFASANMTLQEDN